jgi:type VI secretion system secreted protein VgrG
VKGDLGFEVGANASATIQGNHSLDVRGNSAVMVGKAGGSAFSDQYVHGSASFSARDRVAVRAEQAVVLQCGDSAIELYPDKIVLRSPTIELGASQAIECTAKDGPSLTLSDHVEILTKRFRLFTESGALEVDKEFKAQGDKIKLGYDPSRPSKEKEEKEPETKPFSCKLSNYLLQPYARKKYHVMVEGLRIEGETDAEGTVKHDIPKSAKQVVVRLFLDDYPEGRQRVYTLKLVTMPPAESLLGAKIRLKNLGYFDGLLSEAPDPALSTALAEFQGDHRETHGLEATGDLDEGTAGALEEIHGS